MPDPLLFVIQGTPRPQPRPRFIKGKVVSTVAARIKAWRAGVERAANAAIDAQGRPWARPYFSGGSPVSVEVVFAFRPPAAQQGRIGRPHTQKPDADNLAKGLLDAMQRAGVFSDDRMVSGLTARKVWAVVASTTVVVRPG